MTVLTDADLYLRGAETLLASWAEYARGATGAAVQRLPGVAAAVFPNEPERAVYNNALLERDLAAGERADALDAMEAAYAAAGVTRFAAWVHSATRRCAPISNGAATGSTRRRARWAWRSTTSACPVPRSNSGHRTGSSTYASSGCRRTSSVVPTPPPTTSWSHASTARTSRPGWRSISTTIAGSTTSRRWSTPGGGVWAPR